MSDINVNSTYSLHCSSNDTISIKYAILYRNRRDIRCAFEFSESLSSICHSPMSISTISIPSNHCNFSFQSLFNSNSSTISRECINTNPYISWSADIGIFCIPPLPIYNPNTSEVINITAPMENGTTSGMNWSVGIWILILFLSIVISVITSCTVCYFRRSMYQTPKTIMNAKSTSNTSESTMGSPCGSTSSPPVVPFNVAVSQSVKEHDTRNRMKSHPAAVPNGQHSDYQNLPNSSDSNPPDPNTSHGAGGHSSGSVDSMCSILNLHFFYILLFLHFDAMQ